MHALPSSQAKALLAWAQPDAGLQESVVHGLLSLQFGAPAPGWHVPFAQTSPNVQAFPSLHAFVLLVKTHPGEE